MPNVPDPEKIRAGGDRRGSADARISEQGYDQYIRTLKEGIRYEVRFPAVIRYAARGGPKRRATGTIVDISSTGALLRLSGPEELERVRNAGTLYLRFEIRPGSMPEGYEMMVKQKAAVVRTFTDEVCGQPVCYAGLQFSVCLSQYAARKKDRRYLFVSSLLLFLVTAVIVLMRAESVIYFKFNRLLYLYSLIAAVFLLSRYLFGTFYHPVPINPDFTPGVTIIIPCFNEETWISRTITSCANQDYPIDALDILVVDDCSTDRSPQVIQETIEKLKRENPRLRVGERIRYVPQPQNGGKREALARGVRMAKTELVVFVDSDSFLDVFAIRNLVQPFQDPRMGGVSGRTDVANTYTNNLTKMQAVRYYIAFRIMKAAESAFEAVTCLPGPLSCYKRRLVMKYMDDWLNQKFLGQRATFGDDRSMTNFILRHNRTTYQDTAICSTIVPNDYKSFLKQQMRWKRSWLRESMVAGTFMWRKEPFMALFFYIGLVVPILAPVVVLYNLVWVPIKLRIFPTTFLVGILMMSLLMSAAQLFLRKSTTWLYGMLFCLYYEAVLLWQMPVAWVTFWKSTWGTRMTPEDVKEAERKAEKKAKKKKRAKCANAQAP